MDGLDTFQVLCSRLVGELDEDGDLVHQTEWASQSLPQPEAKQLKQNIEALLKSIKLWKHFKSVYSLSVESNQLWRNIIAKHKRSYAPNMWKIVLRPKKDHIFAFRNAVWTSTGLRTRRDAHKAMGGIRSFLQSLKFAGLLKCFLSFELHSTQETNIPGWTPRPRDSWIVNVTV